MRPAWQQEVVYQIYPRSFADSNHDGMGDLAGILQKVDYLQYLGVDVVWLCPINKSTNFDNGYDVTDYLDIDPIFGNLDDCYRLVHALHQRNIKIMFDLVLNHTSDEHPWFLQEVRRKRLEQQLRQTLAQTPQIRANLARLLAGQPPLGDGALLQPWPQWLDEFRQHSELATEHGYFSADEQLAALAAHYLAVDLPAQVVDLAHQDFYLWHDAPNDWTSIFAGSAWHRVDRVPDYYLALFTPHQPDLNWRNPWVRYRMRQIIDIWLARGIDGFRLDSVGFIAKHPGWLAAPPEDRSLLGRGKLHFINRPEVHAYLQELQHGMHRQGHIRCVGEVSFSSVDAVLEYSGLHRRELSEVFVFGHMYVDIGEHKWQSIPFEATKLKQILSAQQRLIHNRAWLANYFENHDQLRVVSRFGSDTEFHDRSAKLYAMLLLSLQGTPYIYQGQEIGMTNFNFEHLHQINDVEALAYYHLATSLGQDPSEVFAQVAARNRDHMRTVMQWSAERYAGFSTAQPWTVVHSNHVDINVANNVADKRSVLHFYRHMIGLRKTHPVLVWGDFTDILPHHPQIYLFRRCLDQVCVWVVLNLSEQPATLPVLPEEWAWGASAQCLLSNVDASLALLPTTLPAYAAFLVHQKGRQ